MKIRNLSRLLSNIRRNNKNVSPDFTIKAAKFDYRLICYNFAASQKVGFGEVA